MVNRDIFLGSGASLTFVPETDIAITTNGTTGDLSTITFSSTFTTDFSLVNNLYVGCIIKRYANGTNAFKSSHRVTGNTATTVDISPAAKSVLNNDYFVIEAYGAPTPGGKDGTIKHLLADEWLGIVESATFPTTEVETKQMNLSLGGSRNKTYQYKGIETASGGNFAFVANHASFLYYFFGRCTELVCTTTAASGSITATAVDSGDTGKFHIDTNGVSLTNGSTSAFVETGPIFTRAILTTPTPHFNPAIIGGSASATLATPTISNAGAQIEADNSIITDFTGVGGLTITGGELVLTLSAETSTVTFPAESGSNYNSGFLTINLASPSGANGVTTLDILFDARSATVATSTGEDSVTVLIQNSATGAEIAQSVLTALAGKDVTVTRSGAILTITNKTGGYVGAAHITETTTTATTETMGSVAGGIVTAVSVTDAGSSVSGSGNLTLTANTTGGTNIDAVIALAAQSANPLTGLTVLTEPTESSGLIQNHIEYTFGEQDGDLLPSFAIEQVFSKLATTTNTYRTETDNADESLNFVKIARGCRVNTLTMTANANEEVKMTMDYNTRNVHSLERTEPYEARRGIETETDFINYTSSSIAPTFLEPFFFSDGTFSIFGESFLKITTMSLTMNNNLQDKRFLGVGSKSIQEAIPAERTYELQFNGHVTNDKLYTELLKTQENTTQDIELIFAKANGESITLKFKDYFVSANNFPIPDDKGAIEVETTVMPRNLAECKVKTHWILQG